MVYAFAADPGDHQRESSHHAAGNTAEHRGGPGVLFLALATTMGKPGTGDSGIACAGMGMDTLLHFNLAHGSSPGRRAVGKTPGQGFKLITPFVAIASILAAAQVKLLRNPIACAIL